MGVTEEMIDVDLNRGELIKGKGERLFAYVCQS